MIILENKPEPKEAFHYKPPDKYTKEKYSYIFSRGVNARGEELLALVRD